jgi:NAD(P)-dependent dehydrogenase (short-subunit alcohol dehydrogenase family)
MRVAITGHTAGLGKALFDRYGKDAIGFSRSNGYDISDSNARTSIVSAAAECDVFINNASRYFHQVHLLYELHAAWRDTPRLIINISSNTGDGVKSIAYPYTAYKTALDVASKQLSYLDHAVMVCCLRPGWIDTQRAKDYQGSKITVNDMCDLVDWVIHAPTSLRPIEMTVLPR